MDQLFCEDCCAKHKAETFCDCTQPPTLLCEDCLIEHYRSLKCRKHFQYPLAAWRYATHPGYLDQLQERILFFPLVQEQTRKNLEEIERCKGEFIAKTEKCIQELVTSSKSYVQKLEEIKRNLEVSLLEVQSTLAESKPKLTSEFGDALRRHVDLKSADFELFRCFHSECEAKVRFEVSTEANCVCELKYFPSVTGSELRLYDVETCKLSHQVEIAVAYTKGTVFCLLNYHYLLAVGGCPASNSASALNVSDAAIYELKPMNASRSYAGVVKVKNCVYVFGSRAPALRSCEVLDRGSWRSLPDMTRSRAAFTPCEYKGDLYLPDDRTFDFGSLEIFSLARQQFRTVQCEVQRPLNTLDRQSAHLKPTRSEATPFLSSFVVNEVLYILRDSDIWQWEVQTKDQPFTSQASIWCQLGRGPIFVRRGDVLLAGELGQAYQLDPQRCLLRDWSPDHPMPLRTANTESRSLSHGL